MKHYSLAPEQTKSKTHKDPREAAVFRPSHLLGRVKGRTLHLQDLSTNRPPLRGISTANSKTKYYE